MVSVLRLAFPALLATLAVAGCGRTPSWLPDCGRLAEDAEGPIVACNVPAFCGIPERVEARVSPANALVVMDRSCSMANVIEGRTKWSRAVEAVVDTVSDPRASSIRWGLTLFPSRDGIGGSQGPILVPVGEGQGQVVASLLTQALNNTDFNHPFQPNESCFTNLAAATEQATERGVFGDLDGRSHVILISDGLAERYESSVIDLQELDERGISTFVVGFGENINPVSLSEMGEAGGVPASAETPYYRAGLDDLGAALSAVVQGLQCWYSLEVPDEDRDRLEVSLDGDIIPFDPTGLEGWRYAEAADAVVFAGQACDRLLTREVDTIDLRLRCE